MIEDIKIHKKVSLSKPVLLAGWPGMGNVAIGAMDYFRQKLKAEFFAEINMNKYIMPESILVTNGLAAMPQPPRNYFYYIESPPVMFFESETQFSGEAGMGLMKSMIQFCNDMNVQRIYTGAAFSLPASHKEPSEVYGVGTDEKIIEFYKKYSVKPMGEGQISGLNGMLIGYAKEAKIDAVCLLATMPVYAVNFPNPKASKALIEVLMKMTGIEIDLDEIDEAIEQMEQKMESIEQNLKELFPDRTDQKSLESKSSDNSKSSLPADSEPHPKAPAHVLDKIERFFIEARQDREKAAILKEELDRWNLYKLYEDRFLNLFKEKH
ncbi:MAG: PAC2 family protein [bacterium]